MKCYIAAKVFILLFVLPRSNQIKPIHVCVFTLLVYFTIQALSKFLEKVGLDAWAMVVMLVMLKMLVMMVMLVMMARHWHAFGRYLPDFFFGTWFHTVISYPISYVVSYLGLIPWSHTLVSYPVKKSETLMQARPGIGYRLLF